VNAAFAHITGRRTHAMQTRTRLVNIRWIFRIAALLLTATGSVHAQNYPTKPVTFVVPFGPGSGNDVIARIVAQKVGENWNQQVVVENRPGASGGIAMEHAARARPDGYTVVIASTSHIVNQFVSKTRYDVVKDFAPVSVTGSLPYVVAVTQASPARSMNDLVAIAKSRPGKINYAAVPGGVPHFMGEMFKSARGLDIMMIPYKSTTNAEVDVISGRVEIWFTTLASALPLMKGNRVRILGISGDNRAAVLPDVPTMTEAGLPAVDVTVGFFFLTAAGTPAPVVAALNREIVKAIAAQDVRDRLAAAGVDPKSSTSEELDALLKSEVARWSKIIKDSGVRIE
jgi:tripartite-type tricarboxylate transporter receptor subunit TctC